MPLMTLLAQTPPATAPVTTVDIGAPNTAPTVSAPVVPTVPVAAQPAEAGTATTSAPGTAPTTQNRPTGGFMDTIGGFLPFILIFVVLYFLLFRGKNKEEKLRKKMLESMKKGDEVMTIGGLIGKVVEVREDRVIVKVDEANNVKETYLKSAIQKVLSAEDEAK